MPSSTLGSFGPFHLWCHKSWVSFWGPFCVLHGEVLHGLRPFVSQKILSNQHFDDYVSGLSVITQVVRFWLLFSLSWCSKPIQLGFSTFGTLYYSIFIGYLRLCKANIIVYYVFFFELLYLMGDNPILQS